MTTSLALAVAAKKAITEHPAETAAAVKALVSTIAPVVIPVAVVGGIGFGLYKLFSK